MKENKYFSKKQVEEARNTNILEYLISKSEPFCKQGHYYRHTEHSSWVYDDRKKRMHFNKSIESPSTTSCIDVAMRVYGLSFPEAIGDVLGSEAERLSEKDYIIESHTQLNYKKDIKEARAFSHVYNYLANEREIDDLVIQAFKRSNLIAEDVRKNIVFKFIDRISLNPSKVIGVELRGTSFIPEKKRMIPKRSYYLFQHPGNEMNAMFFATLTQKVPTSEMKVFEAPIEVMSYLSLEKERYFRQPQVYNTEFCSMGGLKLACVEEHFKKVIESNRSFNAEKAVIPKITLCVNNDGAGMEFIDRFRKFMLEKGYSKKFVATNIQIELPESSLETDSFDYNDLLKEKNRQKKLLLQQTQEEKVM